MNFFEVINEGIGVPIIIHYHNGIAADIYYISKNEIVETDNKSYIVAKLKRKEHSCSDNESIENKCDQALCETVKIYRFDLLCAEWRMRTFKIISNKLLGISTPLDLFKEKGFYKLIENETEFNEYMSSDVSCNDWCRIKLVKKMKEMGLGVGFINAFADLIGNDLERYKIMIELANECKDKDILMYMLTQKFNSKENLGVGNACM